jgi:hypothetical protein
MAGPECSPAVKVGVDQLEAGLVPSRTSTAGVPVAAVVVGPAEAAGPLDASGLPPTRLGEDEVVLVAGGGRRRLGALFLTACVVCVRRSVSDPSTPLAILQCSQFLVRSHVLLAV